MKYEIKKIDIWSTAKFVGIFYGLIAFVPVLFGVMGYFLSRSPYGGNLGIEFFFTLMIPLGVFLAGIVMGALFALIYNAVAGHVGGFKMEIDYHEGQDK